MIFDFNDGWTLTKENGESFSVCLPHDAMLGEKRYASCRNAVQSGYFPGGKYRYTKTFQINESDLGKNIRLHFGGVYRNAVVSVNGEAVKENKYGYSPFTADLTEKVTSGKNTGNGCGHFFIGDDKPVFICLQLIHGQKRVVGLYTNKNKNTRYRESLFAAFGVFEQERGYPAFISQHLPDLAVPYEIYFWICKGLLLQNFCSP